ncbi:hypothetical protein CEXT_468631 [Caerostris extrusa]|uniref:Uncharacterized protein n=1 Tax=Caerostris extrusa TaxID=172846 RepID=A0AAV4U108_CAEEX|nr:hypothetical protein CEXT_468631 [Caerostris extrusa]
MERERQLGCHPQGRFLSGSPQVITGNTHGWVSTLPFHENSTSAVTELLITQLTADLPRGRCSRMEERYGVFVPF